MMKLNLTLLANLVSVVIAFPCLGVDSRPTDAAEFASFGIDFTPPAAWSRQKSTVPGMIAMWGFADPSDPPHTAVLSLFVEPTHGRNLSTIATEFAGNFEGALLQDSVTAAGEQALVVRSTKNADHLTLEDLFIPHASYAYIIGTAAKSDRGLPNAQRDLLCKNLHFVEFKSPADSGPLRDFTADLGRTTFKLKLLPAMRPHRKSGPTTAPGTTFSAFNYADDRPDLVITLSSLVEDDPHTIDDTARHLAEKMNCTWTHHEGECYCVLSSRIVRESERAHSPNAFSRYGLVRYATGAQALVIFSVDTPHPTDVDKYERDIVDILRSICVQK